MTTGLELLADVIDGRLHAAVVRRGVLDNLYVDPQDRAASWGSLYAARVAKIDRRLDAAIVEMGDGLKGYLPAKHLRFRAEGAPETAGIADLVSTGQVLMVQVKAEGKKYISWESHKLPRVTARLYAFGQHVIHSPLSDGTVMSQDTKGLSMPGFADRLEGPGGWILRPGALAAAEKDVLAEACALQDFWRGAEADFAADRDAPRLLRAGPDALARALNDYGAAAFDHIHAGDKDVFSLAAQWAERHAPGLAASKRLRLFRPDGPRDRLFDLHDVYSALAALQDATVPLKGGGSVIIEETHAVTVADVNQGNAAGISDVNVAAALEIARQTRLRNLSGALLLDFIHMHKRAARKDLVETLDAAYAGDFALAQVHGFTRLGIIEVTRKRRAATLAEKLRH